jgi:hypothetical protein
MAISNRFWPLGLSVESLVLREIAPIAELAETRFAGGYPAFGGYIEPYLAVWPS